MKFIEKIHEDIARNFEKGGPLEKFHPVWEAHDTFVLSPRDVTKKAPHVRDALDIKRLMSTVIVALLPCVGMAAYNTGYQSLAARGLPFGTLDCLIQGLWLIVPIILTSYAVGGFWEVLFSVWRGHEINEGFLVTGLLFPLTLPPTMPLWMVAAGVSFGVVLGKEVFGGTGYNVLNPALTARAFVFFAYPAAISGDKVWTFLGNPAAAVDGFSGATALGVAATYTGPDVVQAIQAAGYSFNDAFMGWIPGSIGETSTLACLIGALILVATGIGSWRIMASMTVGGFAMALLLNWTADAASPGILHLPPYWHLVLGGFAFGAVYMATDPVSAASTEAGKWVYGFLIGCLAILVRAVNPAYPEGVMLAILFMNVFAPLIDYCVLRLHFKGRRAKRGAHA